MTDGPVPYHFAAECALDGSWSGYFIDVPGCTTSADSHGRLLRNAAEALELHLGVLRDHGDPLPRPAFATHDVAVPA